MGIGGVDAQVDRIVGFGVDPAMHDQHQLVVTDLQQKLGFGTGRLDHMAFAASDVDGMRKRLQSKGVKFRESIVPRTGDTQFFLYDPDGVGVELNFPKT